MLVYLKDVVRGGETRFTETTPVTDVFPRQGRALVFFPAKLPSATNPGRLAKHVEHEARPVVEGEKWIVQQWVWSHAYKGY